MRAGTLYQSVGFLLAQGTVAWLDRLFVSLPFSIIWGERHDVCNYIPNETTHYTRLICRCTSVKARQFKLQRFVTNNAVGDADPFDIYILILNYSVKGSWSTLHFEGCFSTSLSQFEQPISVRRLDFMGFLMRRVGLVSASFIFSFVMVTYGEYEK